MGFYKTSYDYYSIVDFPKDHQNYGKFKAKTSKEAASKIFTFLIKFIDISDINSKNNKDDIFLGKFIVFVIKKMDTNK